PVHPNGKRRRWTAVFWLAFSPRYTYSTRPIPLRHRILGALDDTLNKLPERARVRFRDRLPASAPYTLTHGDLASCNIIVKDGQLAGILDWETAGYFPVWWEYAAAGIGLGTEDGEWRMEGLT